MRRSLTSLLVASMTAALAGTAGCASGSSSAANATGAGAPPTEGSTSHASAAAVAPLAALAAERVVLVPTQQLRDAGGLGWRPASMPARSFLDSLDAEIAHALDVRGVARTWVMPADAARSARRNPTFAADPYTLAVAPLAPGRRPPPREGPLPEPLASQLRAIVALGDARYVLIPVELRFERVSAASAPVRAGEAAGSGRAVLRVALVDARASQVRWAGDVASDAAAGPDPALSTTVAARLADLIVPR